MILDDILSKILSDTTLFLLIKSGVLFLLFIYFIFSLIMMRQVTIMMKVIIVPVSRTFQTILFVHVILALVVLLFALIII